MPNRIIKESVRESESVDGLSPQAEVTFYRLITYADDYGLFKADPRLLLAALYPLKNFKSDQMTKWMDELGTSGMITYYQSDGKCYGKFITWEEHQQVRNKKSRFPMPNGCDQFSTLSDARNHLKSNEIICDTVFNPILSNPIQSESNPNPICSEPETYSEQDDGKSLVVIVLPLVGKEGDFEVYRDRVTEWSEAYPAVNVIQELRNMRQWCIANPAKRKTSRGVMKFITSWLQRRQDKGGMFAYRKTNSKEPDFYSENEGLIK